MENSEHHGYGWTSLTMDIIHTMDISDSDDKDSDVLHSSIQAVLIITDNVLTINHPQNWPELCSGYNTNRNKGNIMAIATHNEYFFSNKPKRITFSKFRCRLVKFEPVQIRNINKKITKLIFDINTDILSKSNSKMAPYRDFLKMDSSEEHWCVGLT
ncbi:hypothetical protein EGW08_004001 [Elysia chlorotica]|uniref:Uncharacterized protein n=1 Tax=Elysia chlorotica TaxID=188477 RepID=A0A3S1BH71_ELYCH|nr:hypothetical protein EGW08_004001 [Elysia chlorotica]